MVSGRYIKNGKFRTVKCSDNIFVRNFYRPKFFVSEIFRCPKFFDSYNFVRNTFGSKPSYLIPFFCPMSLFRDESKFECPTDNVHWTNKPTLGVSMCVCGRGGGGGPLNLTNGGKA